MTAVCVFLKEGVSTSLFSFFLFLSPCSSLSVCLSVCLSLCVCVCLSLSLSLFISHSLSLMSICMSVCLCLCFLLSLNLLYIYIYIYKALPINFPPETLPDKFCTFSHNKVVQIRESLENDHDPRSHPTSESFQGEHFVAFQSVS